MDDAAAIKRLAISEVLRRVGGGPTWKTTKVFECFGWPTGVSPVSVAIARLLNVTYWKYHGGFLFRQ